MRRCACPSADRGKEGVEVTPSRVPVSLPVHQLQNVSIPVYQMQVVSLHVPQMQVVSVPVYQMYIVRARQKKAASR